MANLEMGEEKTKLMAGAIKTLAPFLNGKLGQF